MGIIRGTIYAFRYVTGTPAYKNEMRRELRKQYRNWKIFDRERHLQKGGAFFGTVAVAYFLYTWRPLRILLRLPSEDPNYLMKSDIFQEERESLLRAREANESKLIRKNAPDSLTPADVAPADAGSNPRSFVTAVDRSNNWNSSANGSSSSEQQQQQQPQQQQHLGNHIRPFGDTRRSPFGGSPLYSSGDGDIPSPAASLTGLKKMA